MVEAPESLLKGVSERENNIPRVPDEYSEEVKSLGEKAKFLMSLALIGNVPGS